nr:hypothetical protein [Cronobacter dublinensis]
MDKKTASDFLLVNRKEDAFIFSFEQNLPPGYKIWQDVVSEYEQKLRLNGSFAAAQLFVSNELE